MKLSDTLTISIKQMCAEVCPYCAAPEPIRPFERDPTPFFYFPTEFDRLNNRVEAKAWIHFDKSHWWSSVVRCKAAKVLEKYSVHTETP